jgi:hypothetical protein
MYHLAKAVNGISTPAQEFFTTDFTDNTDGNFEPETRTLIMNGLLGHVLFG